MLWNPQRASSSVTIVDSFERSSPLDEYSGETADWATVDEANLSWTPPDGSTVLEQQANTGFARITSQSGGGLSNYFPKGTTAECDIRFDTLDGNARVLFGVGGTFNPYYAAEVGFASGELRILDRDTNGNLTELGANTLSPSADTTGTLRIVWDDGTLGGADNDITVSYFEGGSQVVSDLSVNDSSHATNEGIGFVTQGASSSDGRFFDYYRLV